MKSIQKLAFTALVASCSLCAFAGEHLDNQNIAIDHGQIAFASFTYFNDVNEAGNYYPNFVWTYETQYEETPNMAHMAFSVWTVNDDSSETLYRDGCVANITGNRADGGSAYIDLGVLPMGRYRIHSITFGVQKSDYSWEYSYTTPIEFTVSNASDVVYITAADIAISCSSAAFERTGSTTGNLPYSVAITGIDKDPRVAKVVIYAVTYGERELGHVEYTELESPFAGTMAMSELNADANTDVWFKVRVENATGGQIAFKEQGLGALSTVDSSIVNINGANITINTNGVDFVRTDATSGTLPFNVVITDIEKDPRAAKVVIYAVTDGERELGHVEYTDIRNTYADVMALTALNDNATTNVWFKVRVENAEGVQIAGAEKGLGALSTRLESGVEVSHPTLAYTIVRAFNGENATFNWSIDLTGTGLETATNVSCGIWLDAVGVDNAGGEKVEGTAGSFAVPVAADIAAWYLKGYVYYTLDGVDGRVSISNFDAVIPHGQWLKQTYNYTVVGMPTLFDNMIALNYTIDGFAYPNPWSVTYEFFLNGEKVGQNWHGESEGKGGAFYFNDLASGTTYAIKIVATTIVDGDTYTGIWEQNLTTTGENTGGGEDPQPSTGIVNIALTEINLSSTSFLVNIHAESGEGTTLADNDAIEWSVRIVEKNGGNEVVYQTFQSSYRDLSRPAAAPRRMESSDFQLRENLFDFTRLQPATTYVATVAAKVIGRDAEGSIEREFTTADELNNTATYFQTGVFHDPENSDAYPNPKDHPAECFYTLTFSPTGETDEKGKAVYHVYMTEDTSCDNLDLLEGKVSKVILYSTDSEGVSHSQDYSINPYRDHATFDLGEWAEGEIIRLINWTDYAAGGITVWDEDQSQVEVEIGKEVADDYEPHHIDWVTPAATDEDGVNFANVYVNSQSTPLLAFVYNQAGRRLLNLPVEYEITVYPDVVASDLAEITDDNRFDVSKVAAPEQTMQYVVTASYGELETDAIIYYMDRNTTDIASVSSDAARVRWYSLSGIELRRPIAGSVCIRVEDGKARKVVVR